MGNTNDFRTAQPGDKLWSLRYGEVVVVRISASNTILCSIGNTSNTLEWWICGRAFASDVTPDLYWSRPEIVAPEKPERVVMREFTMYINRYENGEVYGYPTKSEADMYGRHRKGDAHKVTVALEVEE